MHWPSITQTPHMEGMITLVGLRGGIYGTNMNRHIERVVVWADVLHATAHNSLPQLEISQYIAQCDTQRLKDAVNQHRYSRVARQDYVPPFFQKVLGDLQTLAMAKLLLKEKVVSSLEDLRPIFSNMLFVTEHSILELGHTAASSDVVIGDATGVEAFKAAALIFTFHGLRDIAITAAFFDILIQRLREGLCDVFGIFFQSQNLAYIPHTAVAAPFLLWLCVSGWKASAIETRQTDREFFAEKAAVICESARIDSLEKLGSHISRVVPMTEYCMSACDGLWADINGPFHVALNEC